MTVTKPPPSAPALHAQAPSPITNPNLSATLRLEYDNLVNDVRRAHELCAEFQRQLAGKSTEADDFKDLFAKTQSDLFQLQDSIIELREERHRLANEAMRATALSRKLVEMTAERDRLLAEIEAAKKAPSAPLAPNSPATDAGVKVVLSEMWRTLERLQTILGSDKPAQPQATAPARLTRQLAHLESSRS